jgi:hypothetical protein
MKLVLRVEVKALKAENPQLPDDLSARALVRFCPGWQLPDDPESVALVANNLTRAIHRATTRM